MQPGRVCCLCGLVACLRSCRPIYICKSNFCVCFILQVTPVLTGQPMALKVFVNGAESRQNCPSFADIQAKLPSSPNGISEADTVDLQGPACSYVYSAYRTPVITGKLSCA